MMTIYLGYFSSALCIALHLTFVHASIPNPPCDGCQRCPMNMPGCCYDKAGNPIEAGTIISNPDNQCYKHTCKAGKFQEDYFCPTGFKAIGQGCYHVGPEDGTWFDGKEYCKSIGGHLAIIDTEEEALALEGEIDGDLPTPWNPNFTQGLVWLGASYETKEGFLWTNGVNIEDGYTNFPPEFWWRHIWNCLTAYSSINGTIGYEWFHYYCYLHYQPLCEADCEEITCKYEGSSYPVHSIMWRDPSCKCTWIECGEDGQPKHIKKEKPCCTYRDAVYGNGEIVDYSMCTVTKCEKGHLVTYPYCTEGFVPITYAGSSSCYHFSNTTKNFKDAQKYCEMKGSKLVEISSHEENSALEYYLKHYQYPGVQEHWLNADAQVCDRGQLGNLRWLADLFDTPVESVYSDFCEGYPDDSTASRCLYMTYRGQQGDSDYCWANSACHSPRQAICEKCSKCERTHMSVCYHEGKFLKDGDVISHEYVSNRDCLKKYCKNGRVEEVMDRCYEGPWRGEKMAG